MGQSSSGTTLTIPAIAVYILLAAVLVGTVVMSYVLSIFPDAIGQLGTGVSIIGIFTFASAQFGEMQPPAGVPRWVSFVVLTIGAVGMGSIGQFSHTTLLTVGAFVTWLTLVGGLLYRAIAQDGGTSFSLNAETWATAIVGFLTALGVYFLTNPGLGLYAFLAAAISIFGMYFHVAGTSITPTPTTPPAAAPPAAPAP